jgi:HEPN domain-containing protein
LLEELGITVAKTHDLDKLLTVVRPHHSTLQSLKRGLLFLTEFAVDTRYPDNSTTKRQVAAALRWADKVRATARAVLGLPLHQTRRAK